MRALLSTMYKTGLSAVLLLLMGNLALTRPLAAVTPYSQGTMPTIAADADLTAAYSAWKSRYLRSITCGTPMMWIESNYGGQALSEGMAYGLLMSAYLDTDSTQFGKLWGFYAKKMDSRGLMNWKVPGDCGGDNGANAATDGDMDAAVALIRAHRRWPAEGWGAKATTLLNAIYGNMIDSCSGLKNGDTWGGCSSGASDAYNPSYFRVAYMPSFDCFEGGTRWAAVRTRSYSILNNAYTNYALPPDWLRNDGSYGRATNSGGYGYDACRAPWSLTQDYLWWGNTTGRNWGQKIAKVFGNKAAWSNPTGAAGDVGDDYNYSNGSKVGWNHENSFIGGAAVSFMATTYSAHVDAFYNELKFKDNNGYYSDSLKVIYLMILTGTFREPCYGGGPIPTPTPSATPTNYAGTPTQTPLPAFGMMFEDFENGIVGNYGYPTTGASVVTQSRAAGAAYAGTYGLQVNANIAASGNGGWTFGSSYANGSNVVDATGAVSLRFRIKTDKGLTFQVGFGEAGTPASPVAGGDGEVWLSTAQNVTAGAAWQWLTIPLSSMTEDMYNSLCNPSYLAISPCSTQGNNAKNLSAVTTVQFKITSTSLAAASIQIDNVEFVLGVQPSPTSTLTPFIGSYNQVFDDIESSRSLNQALTPKMAGTFADTAHGATATVSVDTVNLRAGGGTTASGRVDYNTGTTTSYGAGAFLLSPYGTPGNYVDASGAVFLGLWINAPAGLLYQLEYQEAGTPTSPTAGADGEAWLSTTRSAAGGWEFVQVTTGSFLEDPYNVICNPLGVAAPGPCATSGNGIRDYQAISSVSIKLAGVQGSGTLYFDDVVFVTSFKTNTPTRTPSLTPTPSRTPSAAGTPTESYTPSPSVTNTPTRTGTVTPSSTVTPSYTRTASPTRTDSPTASVTLTPAGTLTDSPTSTPFLGTPSFTQTLTYSLTASPSETPAPPTFTATPTHSPQPGSPTFTNTVVPPTFTETPAPPTLTATPTNTPQPGSPTFTSSPVPPTLTVTKTNTPQPGSPTFTVTLTPSPLPGSPTFTRTPVPSSPGGGVSGPPIIEVRPFPNPNPGSVRVHLNGPVEGLDVKVYTTAMTAIGSTKLGACPGGWVELALPSALYGGTSEGIYYFVVTARRNGNLSQDNGMGRLMLAR